MAIALSVACTPSGSANAGDSIAGSARDANTNEPIFDAWIFEIVREPAFGADVLHVARARTTRSDASGRFSFEVERQGFEFGRRYPPHYLFYHASYGLVRGRADEESRIVVFRPSLRDAHLRQADATAFCGAAETDAMTRKMVELACPPALASHFPNGQPRVLGGLDERGRRDGEWSFFREDGSLIAHGKYQAGASVGQWQFEAPNMDSKELD